MLDCTHAVAHRHRFRNHHRLHGHCPVSDHDLVWGGNVPTVCPLLAVLVTTLSSSVPRGTRAAICGPLLELCEELHVLLGSHTAIFGLLGSRTAIAAAVRGCLAVAPACRQERGNL